MENIELLTMKKQMLESQIQTAIFRFMAQSEEVQRLQLEHADCARDLAAAVNAAKQGSDSPFKREA